MLPLAHIGNGSLSYASFLDLTAKQKLSLISICEWSLKNKRSSNFTSKLHIFGKILGDLHHNVDWINDLRKFHTLFRNALHINVFY